MQVTPDIIGWLIWAMAALHRDGHTDPDLTMHLMLSAAIAESHLNPYAERYGVYPDISFGLAQRSLASHWTGDRTNTPANIAFVRQQVFAHPELDLYHMGVWLLGNLHQVRASISEGNDLRRVDGNIGLAALVTYNAGYLPAYDSYWWTKYAAHVERYKLAMAQARQILESPR